MKLILDMNLSPKLVNMLNSKGVVSQHWHTIGNPAASDLEIMEFARSNQAIVVTCDLDFTAILSNTHDSQPSVIQIRKHDLQLEILAEQLSAAVKQCADELNKGAILTLDARKVRARLLPLK